MWLELLQAFGVSFLFGVAASFFFVLCHEYSEPGGFVWLITALLSGLFFLMWLFVGLPGLVESWRQVSGVVGLWSFIETIATIFLLWASFFGGCLIGTSPRWLFSKKSSFDIF